MLNLRTVFYHDPPKDITIERKTGLVQFFDDLLLHFFSLFLCCMSILASLLVQSTPLGGDQIDLYDILRIESLRPHILVNTVV